MQNLWVVCLYFWSHRMHSTEMRSIATEGVAWSLRVCLLVTLVSRAKTDELIESQDAIWG